MQKDCPLYKEPCHEHACEWYTHLLGTNPQNGQPVDEWGCAISWMPILQIEGAQKMNQLGGSIDSFRNEMVRQNDEMLSLNGPNRVRMING